MWHVVRSDGRGVGADGYGYGCAGAYADAGAVAGVVVVVAVDGADLGLLQKYGTARCTRTSLVVGAAFFYSFSRMSSVSVSRSFGANIYVIVEINRSQFRVLSLRFL
jgi:hypothetical protein